MVKKWRARISVYRADGGPPIAWSKEYIITTSHDILDEVRDKLDELWRADGCIVHVLQGHEEDLQGSTVNKANMSEVEDDAS